MQIKIVGEEDFCEVFSFLGVETFMVQDVASLLEILEAQAQSNSIILVSDSIYSLATERIEALKSKMRNSVIIDIPSPSSREKIEFDMRKVLYSISGVKF